MLKKYILYIYSLNVISYYAINNASFWLCMYCYTLFNIYTKNIKNCMLIPFNILLKMVIVQHICNIEITCSYKNKGGPI